MPYFEARNANNTNIIMIDDAWKNLSLVHKGSGGAFEQYGDHGASIGTVTWTGNSNSNPLIAVRSAHGCGMFSSKKNGNTFTFRIVFSQATNFDYYIFDDVPNSTSSSFGMVIKNASNHVVFDALRKYMRVAGLAIGGNGAGFTPNRKYAVAPAVSNSRFDVIQSQQHYKILQYFTFTFVNESAGSATNVTTNIYERTQTGSAQNASYGQGPTFSIILDVTHY